MDLNESVEIFLGFVSLWPASIHCSAIEGKDIDFRDFHVVLSLGTRSRLSLDPVSYTERQSPLLRLPDQFFVSKKNRTGDGEIGEEPGSATGRGVD